MHQITPIGNRGFFVAFDEMMSTEYDTSTNIYLINTSQILFVCDTYLGPEALKPLLAEMAFQEKEIVVVNSHYHWDHVWGNCHFSDKTIIGHSLCRDKMLITAEEDLAKRNGLAIGAVQITLPNLTFTHRLDFPEAAITILHTPGHTEDSVSVFDWQEKVLFAGDNIEVPIPTCMESKDLQAYITTLEQYLALQPVQAIPGHGRPLKISDIETNLEYLRDMAAGQTARYEQGEFRDNHFSNLRVFEPSE